MKRRRRTSIGLAIAIGCIASPELARSQNSQTAGPQSLNGFPGASNEQSQRVQKPTEAQDSSALQTKILNDISVAVVGGYMSADKAAHLQDTLNSIAMSESHYKSLNQRIPADLEASNILVLKRLLSEVNNSSDIKPDQDLDVNSMKVSIHRMITRALAAGKINNVEANEYYGQLARIEADESELARSTGMARTRAKENLKGRLTNLRQTLEQKAGKSPGSINTSMLCETLIADLKGDLNSSKLTNLEAYLVRKELERLATKKHLIDATMRATNSTEESSLQELATELNGLKVQVNKELTHRQPVNSAKTRR